MAGERFILANSVLFLSLAAFAASVLSFFFLSFFIDAKPPLEAVICPGVLLFRVDRPLESRKFANSKFRVSKVQILRFETKNFVIFMIKNTKSARPRPFCFGHLASPPAMKEKYGKPDTS